MLTRRACSSVKRVPALALRVNAVIIANSLATQSRRSSCQRDDEVRRSSCAVAFPVGKLRSVGQTKPRCGARSLIILQQAMPTRYENGGKGSWRCGVWEEKKVKKNASPIPGLLIPKARNLLLCLK